MDARFGCLWWKRACGGGEPEWWVEEARAGEWLVLPHEVAGLDVAELGVKGMGLLEAFGRA